MPAEMPKRFLDKNKIKTKECFFFFVCVFNVSFHLSERHASVKKYAFDWIVQYPLF